MKITQEVHDALTELRDYARGAPTTSPLAEAINTLDNADVFAAIDDAGPVKFDVDLLYKVVDNPGRGVTIRSYSEIEGYDEMDVIGKAKERLATELARAHLIGSARDLVFLKANTNPCV